MKVLVAAQTVAHIKAARRASFGRPSACIAGELVWLLEPCPTSRRNPNGPCDCGRTFSGMSSDGHTPTAVVRDVVGMSRDDYIDAMRASFDAQGWCSCCTMRSVDEMVDELIGICECLPAGMLVGRCLDALILLTEPEGWR